MAEKIFPKGLKIWQPSASAPAWIKGRISVHLDTFKEWAAEHVDEKGYVSLTLKDGPNGMYSELDMWKPKAKVEQGASEKDFGIDSVPEGELPF